MLDSAFTPKVRSKFYKHDRYEGPRSCTSLRCSWDDLAPCQCLSKRLSQTFIAVILVRCDKHVPGTRNISKTGHFHPCIGSGTNWLRVNCWCYTLQYFIWPEQERNKMDLSSLEVLSHPQVPACALASRLQSKFISRQSVQRLLQTNGASFSRLTSSTIRICFCVFRTVPKHMLMQNCRNCISQLQAGLPCEEDLCIFLWWSYCNVNFGMVEACLPPQLRRETSRNCGAYRIKLKFRDWESSLEISHVEWEAAWNRNLHKTENFPSVPASLVNLVPTEREPSKRGPWRVL